MYHVRKRDKLVNLLLQCVALVLHRVQLRFQRIQLLPQHGGILDGVVVEFLCGGIGGICIGVGA